MNSREKFLNDLFVSAHSNVEMVCISNIFIELHTALRDPDSTIERIATIIEKDPGLTAAILKTANSSYYGLSRKVSTIRMAISILGYKTLERIFLTQAFKKAFKTDNSATTRDLWYHSIACAIAAQQIISIKNPHLAERAFIAGLLHDMGKFLLINYKKDGMDICLDQIRKNPHQYSVPLEMEVFGVNHQEIGEFFADKWLFPEIVTHSIKYHHSLEVVDHIDEMVACVAVANQIVKALDLGHSTAGLIEELPSRVYSIIGFKQEYFEKVAKETKEKFDEITKHLGT